MQTADCRPDTKYRLQTAEWVQNADGESEEFLRLVYNNMSSCSLPSVTQSLSATAFTIICTIVEYSWPISWWKSIAILFQAFNIVFLLCARVGWCDVCTDFTNVIKVDADVDVNECHYWMFNTYNIRETIDSFARGPYYHLFKRYVFILLKKMQIETKTVPSTLYIFDVSKSHHINWPP